MRFRIKHLLVAMTAIAVASAVLFIPVQLSRQVPELTPPQTTPIVVAAFHLQRGNKIKTEYLTIKQWPKRMVPAGAFTNIEDVVDRTVSQSMGTDEVVLEMKVTDKGDGVAAFVEPGMRAFTISTRSVSGNSANMLQPGNYVDVILTLRSGVARDRENETSTLLKNIEILAVDQELDSSDGSSKWRTESVTLHVTPDQCSRLNHAQSVGTLTLPLRSSHDETEGVPRGDLLPPGGEPSDQARPPWRRPSRNEEDPRTWGMLIPLVPVPGAKTDSEDEGSEMREPKTRKPKKLNRLKIETLRGTSVLYEVRRRRKKLDQTPR